MMIFNLTVCLLFSHLYIKGLFQYTKSSLTMIQSKQLEYFVFINALIKHFSTLSIVGCDWLIKFKFLHHHWLRF